MTVKRVHGIDISWSFCHEYPVTWEYCRPMIEKALEFGVKRLEIAGVATKELGNLDAYVYSKSYPKVSKNRNKKQIGKNIEDLRKISKHAHELGLEVDIWHREVSYITSFFEDIEGLFTEDGEINFTGPFLNIIEAKVNEFFDNVPEIDGLVLTLTESMYPVIRVANKQRNPPLRNLMNVMRVFKNSCEKHNKRFIFRPFTALKADFEYIQKAFEGIYKEGEFPVHIKIVPADWHPFLPMNAEIEKFNFAKRMIEIDVLGEYFGQGIVPCCFPEEIRRYVKYVKNQKINNIVARIDRMGARAIDVANELNVFALHKFCENDNADVDDIYTDWAAGKWDISTAEYIIPVLKRTFEIAKKTFYIDQHLLSHRWFPDFSMLKWTRFFGYFKEEQSLDAAQEEWGIISERKTPSWQQILSDKAEAVHMIEECIHDLQNARGKICSTAYEYLIDGFKKFLVLAQAYYQLCRMSIEYMKVFKADGEGRDKLLAEKQASVELADSIEKIFGSNFYGEMPAHLRDCARNIIAELDIEFAVKKENESNGKIIDWVLCGGISNEWRVRKQTHGSKVYRENNIIYRFAGNTVIADGFFEYNMNVPSGESQLLIYWGDTGELRQAKLIIDGKEQIIEAGNKNGFQWLKISLNFDKDKCVPIRFTKIKKEPPMVSQLKIL